MPARSLRSTSASRFVCPSCHAHSHERRCQVCGAEDCEPIAEIRRETGRAQPPR